MVLVEAMFSAVPLSYGPVGLMGLAEIIFSAVPLAYASGCEL